MDNNQPLFLIIFNSIRAVESIVAFCGIKDPETIRDARRMMFKRLSESISLDEKQSLTLKREVER